MNRFRLARRKSLFLATTARLGLHGRLPKDDEGHIEVGPGFAAAADAANKADLAGTDRTDARTDEQKAAAQIEVNDGDDGDTGQADDNGDGDSSGDDGEGDDAGDEGNETPAQKRKRNTAQHIRNLNQRARDAEARAAAAEARAALLEKGGLPAGDGNANSQAPAKPDPTDQAKYPLGVLDDGYLEDLIDYRAEIKARNVIDADRVAENERQQQARAEQHAANLRAKADEMTARGSELFDDFEEKVLADGLAGKWDLTEATFTAASETDYGAQILHALASDRAEATRVSQLSVTQQVKYVLDKAAEMSGERAARRKTKAGDPPRNAPGGRNGSNPIRLDTSDPEAFHKLWTSTP